MRIAAVFGLLVAVVTGCNDDPDVEPIGGETATPTASPDPDPEPTETEPEDPFAVPEEIDEDYAQRVINELLRVRTEALRTAIAANGDVSLPSEVPELVGATNSGPERLALIQELESYLQATNLSDVFLEPQDMTPQSFDLLKLVEGDQSCIVATGTYDISGTTITSSPDRPYFVFSLAPAEATSGRNPTPWTVHDQSTLMLPDDEEAAAPREMVESAELESFAGLIAVTCEAGE